MRIFSARAMALCLGLGAAMAVALQDSGGKGSATVQAPSSASAPISDAVPSSDKDKLSQNPAETAPATQQAPDAATQVPASKAAETSPAAKPETESPTGTAPKAELERSPKRPTPAGSTGTNRKHHRRVARNAQRMPRKVVVREGGAKEPAAQIVPGVSPAEAVRERQNAEQWLGSTDVELKQLAGRKLDERQQETVGQIHNYMDGARSALQEGDVGRASTLAEKASLLSEDLVKH